MDSVYFESSVFLDIFNGKDEGGLILETLRQLKRQKVRVYTSIITIEEVSVDHFRKGKLATENYSKVHGFARVEGITREIALTAAKLEAHLLDTAQSLGQAEKAKENKRRRWDLFHVATALALGCGTFYSSDGDFEAQQKRLGITKLKFAKPRPDDLPLFAQQPDDGSPSAPMAAPATTSSLGVVANQRGASESGTHVAHDGDGQNGAENPAAGPDLNKADSQSKQEKMPPDAEPLAGGKAESGSSI